MLLIMSADAGGGYGTYANAFAPYLAAHIPGRPRITIQFMPGAGGLRAMNYLYTAAPKDGSVIGMVHSGVPFAPLYGMTAANFDPRKVGWIGSVGSPASMCVFWALVHREDLAGHARQAECRRKLGRRIADGDASRSC